MIVCETLPPFDLSYPACVLNVRLDVQCLERRRDGKQAVAVPPQPNAIRPNSICLICCGFVADFVVQLVVQRIHNESNKWSLACSLPHSNLGYLSRLFDGVMKTGTRVAVTTTSRCTVRAGEA